MIITDTQVSKLVERLKFIYKDGYSESLFNSLIGLIGEYNISESKPSSKWDQNDAVLITYGDSVIDDQQKPLQTLKEFADLYLKDKITCIHVLPFFPYSSDDGFSVIDYLKVNPKLGNWDDIGALTQHFNFMTDLVVNHISQQSEWFNNYLNGVSPGKDYFIEVDPNTDLSKVVRPRSLPLLTPFKTKEGISHVWTTFSDDQVDLNFANPQVLLAMLKVLLFYIKQGAKIIRLDAIAFLWKKIGTTCLHLPETHEVVKLMRDVAELANLNVIILTETNVPNKENISYFGEGDEAHMVYQFSMPPLLLHALHTGNATYLTQWAATLPELQKNCTFFNFTASHDGIGVRPLEGLLPKGEFDTLLENMKKFGGHISTKTNSDGSTGPYEINITYFDALQGTSKGSDSLHIQRFLCSQTLMMSFIGIPAFYIHSLTATPNYHEGVKNTGRARTINRMSWDKTDLIKRIEHPESPQYKIFHRIMQLLEIRKRHKAFHPSASQRMLKLPETLVGFTRKKDQDEEIVVVANISNKTVQVEKQLLFADKQKLYDFISATTHLPDKKTLELEPYKVMWLAKLDEK